MFQHFCLLIVCSLVNSEELVMNAADACGKAYQLDTEFSVYIRYNGTLSTEQCDIKFNVTSQFYYDICVQPISLDLDCDTRIQYHEHLVYESLKEGELTCTLNNNNAYEEYCALYARKFFIVIKSTNSSEARNESADIRVYATHDEPTSSTWPAPYTEAPPSSSGSEWKYAWFSVLPGVVIVICVASVCVRRRQRQQCARLSTNISYTNTTTNAATAGQVPPSVDGPKNNQYAQP